MKPSPESPASRLSPVGTVLMGLGLTALSAVAVWCLVGPLTTSNLPDDDLDYIWRAPDVDRGIETAAGVGATLAGMALSLVLFRLAPARRGPAGVVVATAMSMGLGLGVGGRIATSGVIGANIGGGLVILATPPALLVGLGVMVLVARKTSEP